MKLTPTTDRVLVRLDPLEENFGDGPIVRPDIAQEKPVWGEAIAVGPGRRGKRGVLLPMTVRRGERVCVPWATGHDLKIGGRLHVFVHERDILLTQ